MMQQKRNLVSKKIIGGYRFFLLSVPLISAVFPEGVSGALRIKVSSHPAVHIQGLRAIVHSQKGVKRVHVAAIDRQARTSIVILAEVPDGDEKNTMLLNSAENNLFLMIKSPGGVAVALPHVTLHKNTAILMSEKYAETTEIPELSNARNRDSKTAIQTTNKVVTKYRRVKPKWLTMSRTERIRTGEGVQFNSAFADTLMTLKLIPELVDGKVVRYNGSLKGTSRYSTRVSTGGPAAERIEPVEVAFTADVTYAPEN